MVVLWEARHFRPQTLGWLDPDQIKGLLWCARTAARRIRLSPACDGPIRGRGCRSSADFLSQEDRTRKVLVWAEQQLCPTGLVVGRSLLRRLGLPSESTPLEFK